MSARLPGSPISISTISAMPAPSRCGASLKELLSRTGHSSTRAALIYGHAGQDRDEAIAEALGKALKGARETAAKKTNGTRMARKDKKPA